MKKWMIIALTLLLGVSATGIWSAHQTQRQLAEKMIRLHVIANSDGEEDQALKLEVRDAVLAQAEAILKASRDMAEAKAALEEALPTLEQTAEDAVRENGADYRVSAQLSWEVYPAREYESFRLPAGEYLSLRVLIGAAEGRNWWCVVFPPLCQAVTTEEFDDSAEQAGLSPEEVALITGESGDVQLRFKLVDWVGSWWKGK